MNQCSPSKLEKFECGFSTGGGKQKFIYEFLLSISMFP